MRAVLFPGQGSQYVGMGSDFYEKFDIVKETFETVDRVLGFSLSNIILKGPESDLKLTQNTQLVITGGEPLLQQKNLIELLNQLKKTIKIKPRIEIETNGTIKATQQLDQFITQYNVSPKLKNCGLKKQTRINPISLKFFIQNKKSIFKFVLNNSREEKQLFDEYLNEYQINPKKVYIMPACQTAFDCRKKEIDLIEFCKKNQFNYSTRLHILLYNNKKGI